MDQGALLVDLFELYIHDAKEDITGLLAIIPTKGKHWPLAVFSLITIAVSAIIPVIAFLVSLLLI